MGYIYDDSHEYTGSIVEFNNDHGTANISSLTVPFSPIQDLNGYSHPWPAGGGKNLLPIDLAHLKSLNTGGTWADNVYTVVGVQYTINNDGTIGINGTANGSAILYIETSIPKTVYTDLSVALSADGISTITGDMYMQATVRAISDDSIIFRARSTPNGPTATRTVTDSEYISDMFIRMSSGASANNLVCKFQLEKGNQVTSWEPYENICPISGRTGVEVYRTGKNVLVPSTIINAYLTGADKLGASANDRTVIMRCIPNTTYTWTWNRDAIEGTGQDDTGALAFTSYPTINGETGTRMFVNSTVSGSSRSFTTGPNHNYLAIKIANVAKSNFYETLNNSQLELGSIATDHEPYKGNTISVGWTTEAGTVYGGTDNPVTGDLVSKYGMVDLGTLTWTYNGTRFQTSVPDIIARQDRLKGICSAYPVFNGGVAAAPDKSLIFSNSLASDYSYVYIKDSAYSDASDFKDAMSGVQLCYELATPITYQLTPQEVETLVGENYVWADNNDDITVTVSDIMYGFRGWLLKVGSGMTLVPTSLIQAETYKVTPDQRMEQSAERDVSGYLWRDTVANQPPKIEFETPACYNTDVRKLTDLFIASYTNRAERKLPVAYYDPEEDVYKSTDCYIPNIDFPIRTIDIEANTIMYDPIRFAFIGY